MDAETMERLLRHKVSTDTRLLEKGDVFFALVGKRFDAHDFIPQALEKGVSVFVVSDRNKVKEEWLKKADFIYVEDTLAAYGDLACFYRKKIKVPVVAITGSVGKTTVKELLAHLLSARFKVLKNRGTENNLVGVPKTLFLLEKDTEVVVLEMGTNAPGEIERLSSIIRPQAAILTQIGHSHLERLKSLEGVRKEKLMVLKNLERGGILFVNGEDPQLANVRSGVHRVVRVGFPPKANPPLAVDLPRADVIAERVEGSEEGTQFYVDGVKMTTPLVGRHNVLNCLLAIECAKSLGMEAHEIQAALATFKCVPGRLTIKTLSNITFLDDSYNSNPTSFRAALETLKGLETQGKKGVVSGDMLELGPQSEAFHREIGREIASAQLDFAVAAGPLSVSLAEEAVKWGFPAEKMFHVKDSAEAGKVCQKLASAGDLVLIKGSRGMQMEKILECFTSFSTP